MALALYQDDSFGTADVIKKIKQPRHPKDRAGMMMAGTQQSSLEVPGFAIGVGSLALAILVFFLGKRFEAFVREALSKALKRTEELLEAVREVLLLVKSKVPSREGRNGADMVQTRNPEPSRESDSTSDSDSPLQMKNRKPSLTERWLTWSTLTILKRKNFSIFRLKTRHWQMPRTW
jgi:hypothetical protein